MAELAAVLSGLGAIWAAYAGLRRARAQARAYCDDELDVARARLSTARREAETLAAELHSLKMRG